MPIPGTLKRQNRPKLSDLSFRIRPQTKLERDPSEGTDPTRWTGPSVSGMDWREWVDLYFIKS